MVKEKKKYRIYIDEEFCKACNICVELCATDVFTVSESINTRGYYIPIASYPEQCGGCQICELICPEMALILERAGNNGISE